MAAPRFINELTAAGSLSAGAALVVFQDGDTFRTTPQALITEAASFTQSGTGAVSRTVAGKLQDYVNVLDFIPVALHAGIKARTNTTDLTSYIDLADAECCDGTLGFDGVTVLAKKALYFPGGTYKHSTSLTYRGAPWFGDGPNASILAYHGASFAVNAVGTNTARKLLSISGITLDGQNAGVGAYGLRAGFNQRSLRALNNVRITTFPSWGIFWASNSWQMSFYDAYIVGCATQQDAGIGADSAAILNDFDWYKLHLEGCGQAASSTGGGIEISGASSSKIKWTFHGLLLQGNKGAAEAQFTDCISLGIGGLYLESDLAAAGAVDGVIIGGSTNASIYGAPMFDAAGGHAGKGLVVKGTAKASVDAPYFADWPTQISVENTATVTFLSEGNLDQTKLTVASGASASPLNNTYTPTLTNVANLTSSTPLTSFWRREGNFVSVSGMFAANATAGGATSTSFRMSLPIASNLANDQDCAGVAFNDSGAGEGARILADPTNNDALVSWKANLTGNAAWSFQFSYRVL